MLRRHAPITRAFARSMRQAFIAAALGRNMLIEELQVLARECGNCETSNGLRTASTGWGFLPAPSSAHAHTP